MIARFRTLWAERRFLFRVTIAALLASLLIVFLIPSQYESTVQLMPPDSHSGEGLCCWRDWLAANRPIASASSPEICLA